MLKFIILVILGLLIGLSIPIIRRQWGFTAPGKGRPRPNVKKLRLSRFALPVGVAVVACLFLWLGFSILFSPAEPENGEIRNSVTHTVNGNGSAETGSTSSGSGERERLVADSPMIKSALRTVPVASALDPVGKRVVTASPSTSMPTKMSELQPQTPVKPPTRTAPEPKPSAKPKPKPTASKPASIPKPAASSTSGGVQFTVHLASFSEKPNADRSLAKLRAAGVPAFVSKVEINSKIWHRLMAGNFPSKAAAEKYGRDLENKGLTKGMGKFQVKPIVSASN